MNVKITPMLKQYLSIKQEHEDAIVFYRMGDFYEMFFEDAEIASKALEIALTSRNKHEAEPVPMCGVPYRAAKGYIGRLLENGYKVAVCDQVEDPTSAKGLVKREVVRVITPGMIVEDEFLDERSNNFILSLSRRNGATGIAYLDISTGIFRVTESTDEGALLDEIHRIDPREILLPDSNTEDPFLLTVAHAFSEASIGRIGERIFEYRNSRDRLKAHFKTHSLEGFGCESLKAGVGAAGALIHYVGENQKQPLTHLSKLETYRLDQFLAIDDNSCKNLELIRNLRTGSIHGTLLAVIDRTLTSMGGRRLHQWLRYPLIDCRSIKARLDAVEEAASDVAATANIRECLKSVYDLQRIGSKIALGQGVPRDLVALKLSLKMLPRIQSLMQSFSSELLRWQTDTAPLQSLAEVIEHSIRDDAPPVLNEGGIIKEGFDRELDALIRISRDAKGFLARLESDQKEITGIPSLKVRYNKVFGYYIEVPKSQIHAVPGHWIRKQTLVNAERYITEELKDFESKALSAEEKRASLEYEIFARVRTQVIAENERIQEVSYFLADVDCLLALAVLAEENDYHRPKLRNDGRLIIEDGRHPVIEKMMKDERFVPNSIHMDNEENQVLIITGPNMAGKSTVLRQVALSVILAQMGCFVPAAAAEISLTDKIFTRVGALDNLAGGQSTFMVEMEETANILNNATGDSLVIMDEIGRGTSTFDGLSIAWAVAEHLHDLQGVGVKTLFATHYHRLIDLSRTKHRVKNYHIAVREWKDEIIFLRKLSEGGMSRSYGIQVARLAGIPPDVVDRAKEILTAIEKEDARLDEAVDFEAMPERKSTHVQLPLFNSRETHVLKQLKRLDVSLMTPMEAMNCLYDLVQEVRKH
ncbi:MAG: DNA mismatch repair protein MutS [Desulfobacterales bacterium]